jgi:hypothetical protein
MTGYANTLSGSSDIIITGASSATNNAIFAGTVTWTGRLILNITSTGTLNLTSAGKLSGIFFIYCPTNAGTISLQDNLDLSSVAASICIQLNGGSFNTNGYSKTLVLWEGQDYINIGEWTDLDVELRIKELLNVT